MERRPKRRSTGIGIQQVGVEVCAGDRAAPGGPALWQHRRLETRAGHSGRVRDSGRERDPGSHSRWRTS